MRRRRSPTGLLLESASDEVIASETHAAITPSQRVARSDVRVSLARVTRHRALRREQGFPNTRPYKRQPMARNLGLIRAIKLVHWEATSLALVPDAKAFCHAANRPSNRRRVLSACIPRMFGRH